MDLTKFLGQDSQEQSAQRLSKDINGTIKMYKKSKIKMYN